MAFDIALDLNVSNFQPNIYHLVIDEANWLHLEDDLNKEGHIPKDGGFDALICMGNSFAHLPDFEGNQREHEMAINNFYKLLKPGGILMIDHRNYDYILDHGQAPSKNIYYNVSKLKTIFCFKLQTNNLGNCGLIFFNTIMFLCDLRANTSSTSKHRYCM